METSTENNAKFTSLLEEPCPFRLSNRLVPDHYHLDLHLNSELSKTQVSEKLEFHLNEERRFIVLNARNLQIASATLSGGSLAGSTVCDIVLEAENDRVIFVPQSAPDCKLAAGNYVLELEFTGSINDKDLRGFYQTHSSSGITAATQFESTNARMAFVCVDQPGFVEDTSETPKAKYTVSLQIPEALKACSVGAVESTTHHENGFKTLLFTETVPIASYVVVFIVGDLESTEPLIHHSISGQDIPIRVWHEPGQGHLTSFALKCAAHSIKYFEDLYGIAYQGPVLNLVSLKDFMFGAMENHCSHTFREAAILTDEATASITTLKRISEIIAHEISHNWHGNLVTMRWWHGVTAKEMMATFASHLCIDAWKPEFRMWDSFLARRAMALGTDSLHNTRCVESPVGSPEEAEAMYDSLTYEKGCALNYMLLQYLGMEVYTKGCQIYLTKAAFKNADLPEFWAAMSEASGKNIEEIMPNWFHQPGVPAIYIDERQGGILCSQLPFTYLNEESAATQRWSVPLLLRNGSSTSRLLLNAQVAEADLEVDYIVGNVGASGYYRTFYGPSLLQKLLSHVSELSVAEQYTLVNDLWAGVKAGKVALEDYLRAVSKFSESGDSKVWSLISGSLAAIDGILSGASKAAFKQYVKKLVSPAYSKLSEDSDEELKSVLLESLATIAEDPAAQAECRSLLEKYLTDRKSINANLVAKVIYAVAQSGDETLFERYLKLRLEAETPQDKLYFTYALAMFRDYHLVERALAMSVNGEIRSQDAASVIANALQNALAGNASWTFTKENWTKLSTALPAPLLVRIVGAAVCLDRPEDQEDLEQFTNENPIEGFELPIAQCLERQRVNVTFRTNNSFTASHLDFSSL